MRALRRVAVRVRGARTEEARARLLELVPAGFEEVELADAVELVAYVDAATEDELRAAFPSATSTAVRPGWEAAWRSFHRPVVAAGIWIGPPWEEPPAAVPAVVIDPGRAFGTGAHPTTRLCVELLAERRRGSLLDVGCGSGVLSLAATRLGYAPVLAVDRDPVAVEATMANASANGVELETRTVDATTEPLPRADVAVVNVALDVVESLLPQLDVPVAVTSGYLEADRPVAPAWRHSRRRTREGWAADVFERRGGSTSVEHDDALARRVARAMHEQGERAAQGVQTARASWWRAF